MALHHAVVADDVAYGCWRDGGLTILDVADKSRPRLVAHRNWCPPFAGGTHSALPLHDRDLLVVADEAVQNIDAEPLKYTWVLDIRAPANPVTIATMPVPSERDYVAKGGHFGPHNLWENRPEGYRAAPRSGRSRTRSGCCDSPPAGSPRGCAGWFVPPLPVRMVDTRPGIVPQLHAADVYVEASGVAFMTDFNAGMVAVEIDGLT